MVCRRCQGLLVCEIFDDLNIESDSLYTSTRCINCGWVEDAIVRANRLRPAVRMRAITRGMVGKGRVAFSTSASQEHAPIP